MKRTAFGSLFGLAALVALAAGLTAPSAQAATIGVLPVGGSYSDTISSTGPSFSENYNFTLGADASNVSLLATSLSQTSPDFGVDYLEIALYDSGANLLASASGAPLAFFDSFADSGVALGAGAYLFTVFGDVTTGKQAFVTIALAVNPVSAVPIPAAGVMLLTGLFALGGIAWSRRRAVALRRAV